MTLDGTRGAVTGTTAGATVAKTDPSSPCDETVSATVWYSLADVPSRDVVLRLTAEPGLDAVIAVYRVRKGKLSAMECDTTDDDGVATIAFSGVSGELVLVGQETASAAGAFTLQALVPQPEEVVPGRALHGVAHASVEQYLNETDLWHVSLRPGTTYRISFIVPKAEACPNAQLYGPGGPPSDARELQYLHCNAATSFTPGPDGGGRYLLLVDISEAAGRVPYRLQVAPAQPDDTAPGLKLLAGAWHAGRLDPTATDQLDMYRFVLGSRTDVTVELGRPSPRNVSVLLLRDTGNSIAAGRSIRRALNAGTYFAVVRARPGTPALGYRLLLRERGVSTLSEAGAGLHEGHAALGSTVTLSATIGKPVGRVETLEIDRLDPIEGWLFLRTYRLPVVGATASFRWQLARVGIYRARLIAPSRSGYVHLTADDAAPKTGR